MKKWLFVMAVLCVALAAQAGEESGKKKGEGKGKGQTKEQYVEQQKKMAEKKGAEFDQAKVEARFDKMDKNGDGVLTPDEKPQPKPKKPVAEDAE